MTCPVCGGQTKITDVMMDVDCVSRERKCLSCDFKFYTTETDDPAARAEILRRHREHNQQRKTRR